MIKEIPYIESLPSDWNVIPNRYLFYYDGKKVGDEHAQYQLLSLTTAGVKKRDINATGGKVPTSYDNYQTVKKGQMVFCLFDLDCSAVFSGISEYDGMITSAYDVFSTSDKMDTRYADYWFKYVFSNRYYKMYSKNIRYTITGDMFRALKTPVPPLEVQKQISSLLHNQEQKIDNLIANVQAQIEKLKAYKQSLITEVVTKGLDPNAPMKDSGVEWIGKIPKHWQTSKLRTRTTMLTPMRDKPADLSGPIPWIRIEDYCGKYISSSKENLGVSTDTVKAMNLKIYPVGTILCTSSCDLGKCAIVEKELVSNQRFIGIIPTGELVSDFLYYLMLSNAERLNTLSTGSIQANLSRVSFEQLLVQFPPMAEQIEIAKYLDAKCNAADNLISLKESKIEKLQQYKRSLIYEYVTGKKEVV